MHPHPGYTRGYGSVQASGIQYNIRFVFDIEPNFPRRVVPDRRTMSALGNWLEAVGDPAFAASTVGVSQLALLRAACGAPVYQKSLDRIEAFLAVRASHISNE